MGLTIVHVDAFTNTPFTGNPAAVCILPEARDYRWMQNVASEMNLSETAFLVRQPDGFSLRWFTPAVEVDLCGHATLASAHVLWESGHLKPDEQARFHTRSGLLTAQRQGEWIELNFPATPVKPAETPDNLLQALGVPALYVGKNRFDYLVELDSEEAVRRIQPDFSLLLTVPARGVMVTSRTSTSGYDFVSRFFGSCSLLESQTRQRRSTRLSSLRTRRHRPCTRRWWPCSPGRTGSHRTTRRIRKRS